MRNGKDVILFGLREGETAEHDLLTEEPDFREETVEFGELLADGRRDHSLTKRTFRPVEKDDWTCPSSFDPADDTLGVEAVSTVENHHSVF